MDNLINIITLSSESEDSCELVNSGVTKSASELFSDSSNDMNEESEYTNYVKRTATVDLTKSDNSSGVQKIDKNVYVHTTELEDMLILKNNFHIYVPNNVLKRIEIESKPKIFRQRKTNKRNIKAVARVRYNITKIIKNAKLKEEAIKNNYYDMLKMCKPFTINLTLINYDGKYEILKKALRKSYNVANECETHINRFANEITGNQAPTTPHVIPKVGSFSSKDVLLKDSEYNNLPFKLNNIENARIWCTQTMEQILAINASKKMYAKYSKSSKLVTFFELITTTKYKSIYEYYLIGVNGDVESYHLVDKKNLVNSTKNKFEADFVSRGYKYVNSIVASVGCWYGRKEVVDTCLISESAKSLIKGNHQCSFNNCECCCNPLRLNHTKNDPTFTSCKKLFKVKRKTFWEPENSPQADIHISNQKAPQTASEPIIKKVKNVEDINREFDERNISSNNIAPTSDNDSPATIRTFIDNNTSNNIVNSALEDANMILSKEAHDAVPKPKSPGYVEKSVNSSNNFEPSTVKLTNDGINTNTKPNLVNKILQNIELQAIIRTILQKFKDTKIIINIEGQLAAHITKTPDGNAFSPAEIQMLGSLMSQAQNMVNSLSLSHKNNLPIKTPPTNIVNIAPKCPPNTSSFRNNSTLSFVSLCEMSSGIARLKRKDYLLNLKWLNQQQSTTSNKPNNNKSQTYYFGSTKPFSLNQTVLNNQLSKNENIIQLNAEVANTEPSQDNTNIVSSKVTQQNVKAGNYITVIPSPNPQNTSVQTQGLFSINHSNETQVIPIVVPTVYRPVATNSTDKSGNLFALPNIVNFNPIYVPTNEVKKNLNMVSNVPVTYVNSSTSNVYLKNLLGSTTHLLNNTVTEPPKNLSRKKTTPTTKQNRELNFPLSNTQNKNTKCYQNLDSNQNSNSEHTNIDWESQIVCNSVVATNSNIATVNKQNLSQANESTMPKISNVFTLNTEALSSKSVPTEVWLSDSD
ncbi:hypothetical protein K1T71_013008 [Dendrolimus kikuchii]|uniref:Uncharacterized protein n=1 Tax=Dendrolimus kikuchii TaxID=765133 RepID=A0ACC1CIR6_9NEOP|nr:hypothetical protein K1T71_013008 [Dendrolimus kikuchii]